MLMATARYRQRHRVPRVFFNSPAGLPRRAPCDGHHRDPVTPLPGGVPVEVHLARSEDRLGQPGIVGDPSPRVRALGDGEEDDVVGGAGLVHVAGSVGCPARRPAPARAGETRNVRRGCLRCSRQPRARRRRRRGARCSRRPGSGRPPGRSPAPQEPPEAGVRPAQRRRAAADLVTSAIPRATSKPRNGTIQQIARCGRSARCTCGKRNQRKTNGNPTSSAPNRRSARSQESPPTAPRAGVRGAGFQGEK